MTATFRCPYYISESAPAAVNINAEPGTFAQKCLDDGGELLEGNNLVIVVPSYPHVPESGKKDEKNIHLMVVENSNEFYNLHAMDIEQVERFTRASIHFLNQASEGAWAGFHEMPLEEFSTELGSMRSAKAEHWHLLSVENRDAYPKQDNGIPLEPGHDIWEELTQQYFKHAFMDGNSLSLSEKLINPVTGELTLPLGGVVLQYQAGDTPNARTLAQKLKDVDNMMHAMHAELMRALTTNYDEVAANNQPKLIFKKNFFDVTIPAFTTRKTVEKLYDVIKANPGNPHYFGTAYSMFFQKAGDKIKIGIEKSFYRKQKIEIDGQVHSIFHGQYAAHEGCNPWRYEAALEPGDVDTRLLDCKAFLKKYMDNMRSYPTRPRTTIEQRH